MRQRLLIAVSLMLVAQMLAACARTVPPRPVAPTPAATLPAAASPAEIKYQLLDQFPNHFFCDPDYYPVARGDEGELARQAFPGLQANREEFEAIAGHLGLAGQDTWSDEQKLLIYRDHKQLAAILLEPEGEGSRFELQIQETEGQGEIVRGSVDNRGGIEVEEREPSLPTCPICLAGGTRIDTPAGPMAVEELRPGDAVWTVDAGGRRVPGSVTRTVRVPVPAGHAMAHVVLDDGRQVLASPGHPAAGGRALGDFEPGDFLDGGRVSGVERLAYGQPATYDLLPSGDTGLYWANGILVGSTLGQDPDKSGSP